MARVNRNNASEKISGRVDQFVFKQYPGKTVVSKVPDMSRVKWSDKQLEAHDQFRLAASWAKAILSDPDIKAYYHSKAKTGQTAHNVAVGEYMRLYKDNKK
jgi:hypothetical protein